MIQHSAQKNPVSHRGNTLGAIAGMSGGSPNQGLDSMRRHQQPGRLAIMARLFVVAMSVFALSGCATRSKYNQMMGAWKGAPSNDLQMLWGEPEEKIPLDDGTGHIWKYWNETAMSVPDTEMERTCTARFQIKESAITDIKWEGKACKASKREDLWGHQVRQ